MSQSVSDFMIQRLSEWGIDRVYGYSGDGINGVMAGFMAFTHKQITWGQRIMEGDPEASQVIKEPMRQLNTSL